MRQQDSCEGLVLRPREREGGEGGGRAVVRDVMHGRKEVVYVRRCSLVVEAPGGEAAREGDGARWRGSESSRGEGVAVKLKWWKVVCREGPTMIVM